jgi:predicted ester cyclase
MATQIHQTARSRELVQRYCETGIPRTMKGDRAAAREFLADHFVQHTSTHSAQGKHGVDDRSASIEEAVKAIPDLRFSVQRYLADGDCVATHWKLDGTHTGRHKHRHADEHLEGTATPVDIQGITIYRVQDEKIAEAWSYDSHLDFLIEAGALKIGT